MSSRVRWWVTAVLAVSVAASQGAKSAADGGNDRNAGVAATPAATRVWPSPFVDREAYLRARDEHLALLRGLPHFLPYDAPARAAEAHEQTKRLQAKIDDAFWTELGPAPIPNGQVAVGAATPASGRVVALAVHPTNAAIVYAGAAHGGVYRSLDSGVTWTQLFDAADTLAIGALALAPSNPEILYVGTGEPSGTTDSYFGVGLYRIDQASTTATLTGPINPPVTTGIGGTTAFTGRAISAIAVHPSDPATIFVSTTTATSGNPSGGSIGFAVPPLALLGVYRSTNATSAAPAFTKLTVTTAGSIAPDTSGNLAISDLAIDPGFPPRLLTWVVPTAAAPSGGIYLSNNALSATPTFTPELPVTTNAVRGEFAITRIGNDTTIYAATGEGTTGRLRRSDDAGESWSPFLGGGQGFCASQCFYSIAVAIHPTNPNIVHLGGASALIAGRSSNGGGTFTTNAQSAAGVHVDTHDIAIAPSNTNVVYLATDGGTYRSDDAGLTWTSLSNAQFHATMMQEIDLHPTDREFLLGGTEGNGTLYRQPTGSWLRADGGDGGYTLIDQNAADTTNVVMYHTYANFTGQIGFARRTSTAPGGWTFFGCGGLSNGIICAPTAVLFYAPMARGPGSPNTIYFGTDQLWRSTDMGVTMASASQVLQSGQAITTIAISPADDRLRLVGLRNGQVYATTTGATTLNNVTAAGMPTPHPLDVQQRRAVARAIFHPTATETAWIAFGGYGVAAGAHVWKTTALSAGAAAWVASGAGIPDVPVNGLAVNPSRPNQVFAATDVGVYASLDGGGTWSPYSEGLPRVAVFDIDVQAGADAVIRIATHGRGVWERSAPDLPDPLFANGFE